MSGQRPVMPVRVRVKLHGAADDTAIFLAVRGDIMDLLNDASERFHRPLCAVRDAQSGNLVMDVECLRDRDMLVVSTTQQETRYRLPNSEMKEKHEQRRNVIIASPSHRQYYHAYMEAMNATYQMAIVISSGFVKLNAESVVSTLGNAFARHVPADGRAVSVAQVAMAVLLKKVGEQQCRVGLGRIASCFANPAVWFDGVERAAACITTDIRWNAIAALESPQNDSFKRRFAQPPFSQHLSVCENAAIADATAALEHLMDQTVDAVENSLVDYLKMMAVSHAWSKTHISDLLGTNLKKQESRAAKDDQTEVVATDQPEAARPATEHPDYERLPTPQIAQGVESVEPQQPDRPTKSEPGRSKSGEHLEHLTPDKVSDWPVEIVVNWLAQIGLADVAPIFRKEKIDGLSLAGLTADELMSLGVAAFGDRKRLLARRDELLASEASKSSIELSGARTAPNGDTVGSAVQGTVSNLSAAEAQQLLVDRIQPAAAAVTAVIAMENEIEKLKQTVQRQYESAAAQHAKDWQVVNQASADARREFADQVRSLRSDADKTQVMVVAIKEELALYIPCLKKMEEREQGRTNIAASSYHLRYYKAYMEVLNGTYQAAMVIYSGYVDVNADNNKADSAKYLASAGKALGHAPVVGQAVSLVMVAISFLLEKAGERQQRTELGRITSIFANPNAWCDKIEQAAYEITLEHWNDIAALKPASAKSVNWFGKLSSVFKSGFGLLQGSSESPVSVWQLAAVSDATAALEYLTSDAADATEFNLVDRLKSIARSNTWAQVKTRPRLSSDQLFVRIKLRGAADAMAVRVMVRGSFDELLKDATACLNKPICALRDPELDCLIKTVEGLKEMMMLVATTVQQEDDLQRLNRRSGK